MLSIESTESIRVELVERQPIILRTAVAGSLVRFVTYTTATATKLQQ
jgi:hypothetical protein